MSFIIETLCFISITFIIIQLEIKLKILLNREKISKGILYKKINEKKTEKGMKTKIHDL